MIRRAAGHRLGEECCAWFDDLFELLYRLAHNDAKLLSEDMAAHGELALLLYPLHVKVMRLFTADDPILFDPTACSKLDTVLECYSDRELELLHSTTKLEVAMHALYFTARKALDRRSCGDAPGRKRCNAVLSRIMNGAEPAGSVFEKVRRDATTGANAYDPCIQVVSVMPLGLGFLMRT